MEDVAPESRGSSAGASSELRRSVGKATERIHEIIDAAERVAAEIRSDAEAEADAYLAACREESDRVAGERLAALEQLGQRLATTADGFRAEADRMLGEIDAVIAEARAATGSTRGFEAPPEAPAPPPPVARPELELRSVEPVEPVEPIARVEPELEPADADATAEALLRATQMAVTGKDRGAIVAALEADFPGVDAGVIADEILR